MRIRNKRYSVISAVLVLWLILVTPMAAYADAFDEDREGSITITLAEQEEATPIVGAEFHAYRVASVSINNEGNLSYRYTDEFMDCNVALDDPALATALDSYVDENNIPAKKAVTDYQGRIVLSDLKIGLYFLKQTNSVSGYAPCKSFLVTIPNRVDGKYVYDVDASPKTDIERYIDITIKKVWNTGKSSKRADSVTVKLLRDGKVIEKATLSEENNWQVTYIDMPKSDAYSVKETNIPKGFVATYSQKGYEFTVTNSTTLIRTGQPVWPIPVMAIAGICFLTIGAIILHRAREYDAE
ncbi:MAG: Cna B-type domain-containing protein [Parabacteroides sp.]|nr:Cna B-type domain-containing protein [Parabacteroides sp.]